MTKGHYIYSIIPITSEQYWYASAYFGLMIFLPLLNEGIIQMRKNMYTMLIVFFLFFIVICTTLWPHDAYKLEGGYSMVWLAMMYMLGAYLNKYDILKKINIERGCALYILMIAISVGFILVVNHGPMYIGRLYNAEAFISYTSPTIIVEAVALLAVFEKITFSFNAEKVICFLAPATFGVYLLHVHPIVWNNIVLDIGLKFADYNLSCMLLSIFVMGGVIFVIGTMIDLMRIKLFNILGIRSKCIRFCNMIRKLKILED